MRKGVIYLYTFPNGKVYVGQTRRDPQIRHREHFDPKIGPKNGVFWKAYQEQGEPKYEILEEYEKEDVDELINILNEREAYFISYYRATHPDYGYNVMPQGTSRPHIISKLNGLCYAYTRMMWEKVWPIFDSVKNKIDQEDTMDEIEKELYQEYFIKHNPFLNSLKDSRPHDVSDDSSDDEDDCDDGSYDLFVEHWFEYAEFCLREDLQTMAEEYVHENAAQLLDEYIDKSTIYQLNLDGEIIAKFDSQQDAAIAMGAKNSVNINNVILGKQKTAYGFKWVKALDYHSENL